MPSVDLYVNFIKIKWMMTSFWYQGTVQKETSNDISFLDLDLRSITQLNVEGHRRGGVCVLLMLLVFHLFFSQEIETEKNLPFPK